jgi:hypothetical protein
LTQASGGPKAWGRPWIEWANPHNPGAMVFTLNNATEDSEWHDMD